MNKGNSKPPAITIWPDGHIYVSSAIRKTLGKTFDWSLHGNMIELWPKAGVMYYEDNGGACDCNLPKALGIKKKTKIALVERFDKWEGMMK